MVAEDSPDPIAPDEPSTNTSGSVVVTANVETSQDHRGPQEEKVDTVTPPLTFFLFGFCAPFVVFFVYVLLVRAFS